MNYVRLADVEAGQSLVADGGFTCLAPGEVVHVHRDANGALFVSCDEGQHFLDGQEDESGRLVGLLPFTELFRRRSADTLDLLGDILDELDRARAKFPGDNVTTLALVEEVGELAKATFEETAARVRKEAVQVAVMAMRVVLDGDATLGDWRRAKGLDQLGTTITDGAAS